MSKNTQAESTQWAASKAAGGGQRKALLVAINDYKPEINRLPSCIADAERVESLLKKSYGFTSIQKLYNEEATKANVERALGELFDKASTNDRIVFYFSGHGYQYPVNGVKQEALVLYDGMMSDEAFVEHSKKVPSGIFTVVLDSCFSGGMQQAFYVVDEAGEVDAKVKSYIDVDHPQGFSSSDPTPVRHFGERSEEGDSPGSFAGGEPSEGLNGVLLSACSKNETAAAGVARTEHLSAFTYALSTIIRRNGPRISYAALMDAIKAELKVLRFRQTPTLWAPGTLPAITSSAFITCEPVPTSLAPGARPTGVAPVSAGALAGAVNAAVLQMLSQGAAPHVRSMAPAAVAPVSPRPTAPPIRYAPSSRQRPAPAAPAYSSHELQARLLGSLLPAAISVLPQLLGGGGRVHGGYGGYTAGHHAPRRKDYEAFVDPGEAFTDEDPDEAQQKLLGALLPGLMTVLPQLIHAATQVAGGHRPRRKDYEAFVDPGEAFTDTDHEEEEVHQKFLPRELASLLGMLG